MPRWIKVFCTISDMVWWKNTLEMGLTSFFLGTALHRTSSMFDLTILNNKQSRTAKYIDSQNISEYLINIDYYQLVKKQKKFDIFVMVIQVSINIQKSFDYYIIIYPEIQVQFQVLSIFKKQRRFEVLQSRLG